MEHGTDLPATLTAAEAALCPRAARISLARYLAGEISPEIALTQLLLQSGSTAGLMKLLEALTGERAVFGELRRVANDCRGGLECVVRLVDAGLTAERAGDMGAIREQFDRA